MRKYSVLFVLMVLSAPAFAQEGSFEVLCRTLPEYQRPSQGVAYQAGVDVQGKPVVPADLNALDATLPDVIKIPVTVDLAQRYALMLPKGMELKPEVSALSIHKDGRVTYNDQDITNQTYSVCAKDAVLIERTQSPPAASAPMQQGHGQSQAKPLDLPIVPELAKPADGQ